MTSKPARRSKPATPEPSPAEPSQAVLKIQPVGHSAGLAMPKYESEGAAGLDLLAAITGEMDIPPGEWRLVPTGISIELPPGFEAQVRPRSGLALKNGVTILNSPGTIDRDYRGEVGAVLVNHGDTTFTVRRGMRVAQLVVAPVATARIETADTLAESTRGRGGFGSTGGVA